MALLVLCLGGCGGEPDVAVRGMVVAVEVPAAPAVPATTLAPMDARCDGADSALRPLDAPGVGSTVALGRLPDRSGEGRRVALVADEDAREIRLVDLDAQRELSALALHATPGQLMIQRDGRVVVTLRDRGRIAVLTARGDALSPLCTREVASEPVGLADTGDGVVVTSRWGRRVSVFDGAMTRIAELPVGRDPHGVAVVDGIAYVSHVVGGTASVIDLKQRKVTRAPLTRTERVGNDDDNPSFVTRSGAQGYAAIPSGEGVAIPLMMTDPGDARVAIDITGYGGGTSVPVTTGLIARFDGGRVKPRFARGLPSNSVECPLPRAAAYAQDALWVACQGTDRVIAYGDSREARSEHRASFSVGRGPTGIALAETDAGVEAVVWSQFDRELSLHAIGEKAIEPPVEIALSPRGALDEQIALGRELFHAAGQTRISFDGRACASCHPDGRDDGLTWATDEGPRQTPILMGRLQGSAPYGWNGDMPTLQEHLRRTLRRLGGSGLTAHERDALVAYIDSLQAPGANPLDEVAQRGASLFASAATGCSGCHVDVIGSDGIPHDVGALAPGDDVREFDTPSLRFISQSAPYFHDGRYPTLVAMLRDEHMKMGQTDHLSPDELDALAAYLETL